MRNFYVCGEEMSAAECRGEMERLGVRVKQCDWVDVVLTVEAGGWFEFCRHTRLWVLHSAYESFGSMRV